MKSFRWFPCCVALSFGLANAATVDVNLDEEHQVIRGFGGMVHNTWQGGAQRIGCESGFWQWRRAIGTYCPSHSGK